MIGSLGTLAMSVLVDLADRRRAVVAAAKVVAPVVAPVVAAAVAVAAEVAPPGPDYTVRVVQHWRRPPGLGR